MNEPLRVKEIKDGDKIYEGDRYPLGPNRKERRKIIQKSNRFNWGVCPHWCLSGNIRYKQYVQVTVDKEGNLKRIVHQQYK